MRLLLVVLALGACAAPRDPAIVILSPDNGTVVTDHAPVKLTIETHDLQLRHLRFAVDGISNTESPTISPAPAGAQCDPCTFDVSWPALDVREGSHVITVQGFEQIADGVPDASADVMLAFDDAPEIVATAPSIDEELRGVGTVMASLEVIDRGSVTGTLELDGEPVATQASTGRCSPRCLLTWAWDTRAIPAGSHELVFAAVDEGGKRTEQRTTVTFDDLVRITAMQVSGTLQDDPLPLEMEVYVYDDAGKLLGCAGSMHGLAPVNDPGLRYEVSATLVDFANPSVAFGPLAAAGRPFRFEVWEDDDQPVCPSMLDRTRNDLVGQGALRTDVQWKTAPSKQTFGSVIELSVAFERPLKR